MTVTIELPLPPNGVQQNHRRHWRRASEAIKSYRQRAAIQALARSVRIGTLPGPVVVHHEWFMGTTLAETARKRANKVLLELNKLRADQGRAHVPLREPLLYRPLDAGNAVGTLKAAIDGCVDGGLLAGDSHTELQWGACILHRNAKRHQQRSCVVLTFECGRAAPIPVQEVPWSSALPTAKYPTG